MNPVVANLIRDRRTISSFQSKIPPREEVESAIEVARWAPNHKKTEPWRVYILGPESIKSIIDLNCRLVELKKGIQESDAKRKSWSTVPGWLVVTCQRTHDEFRHEEDYAACCCFVQNLMLGLWSSGIGTKWTTGDVTRDPDFFRVLDINSSLERVVGLIWFGYPAVVPEQTRRPFASFVTLCR